MFQKLGGRLSSTAPMTEPSRPQSSSSPLLSGQLSQGKKSTPGSQPERNSNPKSPLNGIRPGTLTSPPSLDHGTGSSPNGNSYISKKSTRTSRPELRLSPGSPTTSRLMASLFVKLFQISRSALLKLNWSSNGTLKMSTLTTSASKLSRRPSAPPLLAVKC